MSDLVMTQDLPIIAFIGYRKAAIQAAQRLGYRCVVWSNKNLPNRLPENVIASYVAPYPAEHLNDMNAHFFAAFSAMMVIALTEASVVAAALVRQHLGQSLNINKIRACQDKLFMKQVAQRAGFSITPFVLLDKHTNPQQLITQLHLPIYIKKRISSGSRGQQLAHTLQDLTRMIQPGFLAEQNIVGEEMSVEVLVQNKKIIFVNQTTYFVHHHVNIIATQPVLVPVALRDFIQKIIEAYDLNTGILHIELFLTAQGLMLGEFAIRPPGGYIMKLIQLSYGFDPWEALIKIHAQQPLTLPATPSHNAAVYILHPNGGQIATIQNQSAIESLPSFHSIHLKKKIGDHIAPRLGSGEDIGTIIFIHENLAQLKKDLRFALNNFHISLT